MASPQSHYAFAQWTKAHADIDTGVKQTPIGAFMQPDEIVANDSSGKRQE